MLASELAAAIAAIILVVIGNLAEAGAVILGFREEGNLRQGRALQRR